MIRYRIDGNKLIFKVFKIKDKYLDFIENNKEIQFELKNGLYRNIRNSRDSEGKPYRALTYMGFGKSPLRRSIYKPLLPIFKFIYIGTVDPERKTDKIRYGFSFFHEDKYATLIHNTGGVVYNPYAKRKRSYIPKREFLYASKKTKENIARLIRKKIYF